MKIIHLEAADVEQVELKAVEDLTFMQVIEGDDAQHGRSQSHFISTDDNFQVGYVYIYKGQPDVNRVADKRVYVLP